ncbi:hypothetical protein DMB66_36195 [Actinoplanes sp. ATCC 53533]|nr:hypothetical protein DMB66_36195 [Actinoplanes sp. ATCC 53533]
MAADADVDTDADADEAVAVAVPHAAVTVAVTDAAPHGTPVVTVVPVVPVVPMAVPVVPMAVIAAGAVGAGVRGGRRGVRHGETRSGHEEHAGDQEACTSHGVSFQGGVIDTRKPYSLSLFFPIFRKNIECRGKI